jgi:hypothetical protein
MNSQKSFYVQTYTIKDVYTGVEQNLSFKLCSSGFVLLAYNAAASTGNRIPTIRRQLPFSPDYSLTQRHTLEEKKSSAIPLWKPQNSSVRWWEYRENIIAQVTTSVGK